MTTHGDVPLPPLAADDPRISEWLDGRLPADEAAAIERAVAGTPALARLVADLRAIRESTRGMPALQPPAGFTDRVMAAVAQGGAADEFERAVDDEWRAVEAERIAAERVEAAADRAELTRGMPQRTQGPWPWVALGGALAAGLLLAVVLNPPAGGRREVALAPPAAEEAVIAVRGAADEAAPRVADAQGVRNDTAAPAAVSLAESPVPAAADVAARPARAANRASAEADREAATDVQPIEVVVRGPEQLAELLRRITALGLIQTPGEGEPAGSPNLAADGVLELVGPPEALAAFVSEITQAPAVRGPAARPAEPEPSVEAARSLGGGLRPAAGLRDRGRTPESRVVIRIVEQPTAGGESSRP